MGNFKIKVNSEAESKEVQDLLVKMGYHARKNWTERNPIHESIQAWSDGEFTFSLDHNKVPVGFKETTLPELRDMVVLKRNDKNDRNVVDPEYPYANLYLDSNNNLFVFHISTQTWKESNLNHKPEVLARLKPIEKTMKEYLDKQEDGTYKLITASGGCVDRDWIEVPEGAIRARFYPHDPDDLEFENSNHQWWNGENKDWAYYVDYAGSVEYSRVVWQRTPPLNDQDAEIEQVRQHRHYFIDVSDVDEIDFYEIALRYNVTDPCIQHILKKCLAVGQRGQKDFHHDLKDIYDTAKRMLDVHGLDS